MMPENKLSILILGAGGMLGSSLVKWFSSSNKYCITGTTRDGLRPRGLPGKNGHNVKWKELDALAADGSKMAKLFYGFELVINCIGKVKQCIDDGSMDDRSVAISTNSIFSIAVARASEISQTRVVQIGTDCVFSGIKGNYDEKDIHDPTDIYGKSKSLGEVDSAMQLLLRCSIIGTELESNKSLLSWFLSLPEGAQVKGYCNHKWNGIGVLQFAKICEGQLNAADNLTGAVHVLPADTVSKYELLKIFQFTYGRTDVAIEKTIHQQYVDRTLSTTDTRGNKLLWLAAGYQQPPKISSMVREMKQFYGKI
jgi:dTDP-4-dehydrorhamnose reductase